MDMSVTGEYIWVNLHLLAAMPRRIREYLVFGETLLAPTLFEYNPVDG